MRKTEISKDMAAKLCVQNYSLRERPELLWDLIKWMKYKELSVRQAEDLMLAAKSLLEMSWRAEKIEITI